MPACSEFAADLGGLWVPSPIAEAAALCHCEEVPAVDTVLLPLCLGLTLLGIIATVLAARRGNRGRVVQGVAATLAPIALYLSGLLRLLWNGAAALGRWATALTMSRAVWVGLGLLALCLVLWVVGGVVARRAPRKSRKPAASAAAPTSPGRPAVTQTAGRQGGPVTTAKRKAPTAQAPVDDDLAEIEALLKSRGID